MTPLPANVSDSEILAFVERWVEILEREDYEAASAFTDHHSPQRIWTAKDIRGQIKLHGQRATLEGVPNEWGPPTREVTRCPTRPDGYCGDIWYDLYIDGQDTDMTALFYLRPTADGGLTVVLIDIGVR
jgi:hypothetical protein